MPDIAEIREFLAPHGIPVLEFNVPTPTAEDAAAAVGCSIGEIAKTLLFLVGSQPVAVVAPGDRKVNSSRLKQASGLTGKVRFPSIEEVVRHTGYAPGGVCPFLLPAGLPLLADVGLRRFPLIYPAAGTASSGVPLTVEQLLELTGAMEAEVCAEPEATPRP